MPGEQQHQRGTEGEESPSFECSNPCVEDHGIVDAVDDMRRKIPQPHLADEKMLTMLSAPDAVEGRISFCRQARSGGRHAGSARHVIAGEEFAIIAHKRDECAWTGIG